MARQDRQLRKLLGERLQAAEHGDAKAFYDLGLYYALGQGVPRDLVAAHKWFNLAACCGVRQAEVERRELAAEMAPPEIATAQRAAREWMMRHGS
ncbi:MAG: sel1 repeat family protein [Alphaproteobacteria bacterium]|nr:MAG: sel1 repeat family protein [Alphaproteobacteria bacterium]